MSEFQPLIDQLYREEVQRARAQSPEQRFLGTLEMAEFVFAWGRDAVRGQFPKASEAEVEAEWQRRMQIRRRLDDHGIYEPLPSSK